MPSRSDAYDVIVCGGGTAGAVAAIKAARLGSRTLVIEALSGLGGTQTFAWVTPMMPNYLGDEQLCRGMNLEIQQRHAARHGNGEVPNAQVWYDPVAVSAILEEMADEAGVARLYNAMLSAVATTKSSNGTRIQEVTAHTKAGALAFRAEVFVDATGDADLIYLAGGETMSGDEQGVNQPMTLRFTVANVALKEVADYFGEHASPATERFLHVGFAEAKQSPIADVVNRAIDEGVLRENDLGYFQFFTIHGRPGELAFNCPRLVGFDPLDPFSVSEALSAGRLAIQRVHRFLQRFIPGFERSYISVVAPMIGNRESRRVVGEYVLTEEDHQAARKFPDPVARNRYPIDIHLVGGGVDLRALPADEYHEIPYRCLVPKGIANALVAGRCLSATFAAQSSARIQPVCRAMGEAAGAAAALCAASGISPKDLEYARLREHLDLDW
jgi:hypothetical protein